MKLFLNYGGSTTGSGKIKFSNVHELLLIEEALKCYMSCLTKKSADKNEKTRKKIDELEMLIHDLQLENAEKWGKKYDSSIGVNLNHFLITTRHKSKIQLLDVAEKLGVSPSQYNDIEKEKIEADAPVLMKIFETLNVLDNIKVKLYHYIPTIEYYYNDTRIHEVFFNNKESYSDYVNVISEKIAPDKIESIYYKTDL